MYVITADQKKSTKTKVDLVPKALQELKIIKTVLPFERTVGDEIQGVIKDSEEALKAIKIIVAMGEWHCGLGVGNANLNNATKTTEATGEAFVKARHAVEEAKKHYLGLAVQSDAKTTTVSQLEALLRTKAILVSGRSQRQKEIIEKREALASANEVAEKLKLSKGTISKSLRTSNWEVETSTDSLALSLMEEIDNA
ncbi:hypothetical protein HMPREF0044_1300 [Gleimia coleocanis DSM 15436]|uniref:Uncharacterized protein n=1 Tax=Gleimia coleocanis DSM 15436 TaxID=525245 RepID=C0W1L0_9ACTO|nr:SatD family protein [Gleimia coleocanis]EEH63376.1 hypothetical protein HMPREF0044_1300 [Gleimia coleocanis DSM 15436]